MAKSSTVGGTRPEDIGLILIGSTFLAVNKTCGRLERTDAYDCKKIHINRKAGHLAIKMAFRIYVDIINITFYCRKVKIYGSN